MKKIATVLIILFMIIILSIYGLYINIRQQRKELAEYNSQYESYLDKTINGTELTTLINKAINENEKNSISKNEQNYYIENSENSIKIDVKMITVERTYSMEEFYNNDMTLFLQNFNTINFKCIKIEYHENTGKISKLFFEEQENLTQE